MMRCAFVLFIIFFNSIFHGYLWSYEHKSIESNTIIALGNSSEKSNNSGKVVKNNVTKRDQIDNIIPKIEPGISLYKTIALDMLIPGGGHFYRGDYFFGIGFLLLKGLGICSIYYYYNNWDHIRLDYLSEKRIYKVTDPGNMVWYYRLNNKKHDFDRAAQMITFSVVANVVIYAASIIINYNAVNKLNEKSIPTFELSYVELMDNHNENIFYIRYSFRM